MKKSILLITLTLTSFLIKAQNLEFRDVADYQVDLSDVWGWSDGINEYAILGLINAFTIVDVTDPDNIVKLFAATVDGAGKSGSGPTRRVNSLSTTWRQASIRSRSGPGAT